MALPIDLMRQQHRNTRRLPLVRWCTALAALWMSGCTTVYVAELPGAEGLPLGDTPGALLPAYRLQPGDDLDVKFAYTSELNESQKIRPDGFITLQLIDDVKAAGLTPLELDADLTQRLSAKVKNPTLSVIVRSFAGHRAYVGGEVGTPQVVPLDGGITALQAIQRAGGQRAAAQMESVILIRKGPEGQPMPYRLNLTEDALAEGKPDTRVALMPSDVIYLPRTRVANANRFVQQYITDLLLLRGVNFGFNVNQEHLKD
ncbi:sugar transporter [Aquabacterium lacunae]|uniref:Sugar transporter n=2 Tax=Aquabacterium lacunae TaxID=2528630 RepID=A0A4Q9H1L0_9BURK|nr:sugar transporter [Aquabacterium lacunae]